MRSQVHKPLVARNVHRSTARDGVEIDGPSKARDSVEVYHQVNTPISEQESNMCTQNLETLIFGYNVAQYGDVSTS